MPVDQVLEGSQQERTRPTRRVDDPQVIGFFRGFAFEQFAHRVGDDVIHDVPGGVVDPAGFAHFGFFVNLCYVPRGETDDLAEELLVNLTKDLDRDGFEVVVPFGVIEMGDDLF